MDSNQAVCWHTETCADEMNRAYDNIKDQRDGIAHLASFSRLLSKVPAGSKLLDLGCGTGTISDFCKGYDYVGADLPHILAKCAMRNYPQYLYRACDLEYGDLSWIREYDCIVMSGVIDIMQDPLDILNRILMRARGYIILHRQEIVLSEPSGAQEGPGYGGFAWHSKINRADLIDLLEEYSFDIIAEETLEFTNWQGGGNSFLLRKRKSWALHKIDYMLNKIFEGKENGYFIEAGANDGLRQSNTMYLEFYKNWRGVLIEPIPPLFADLQNNRSSKSSYCWCALLPSNGDVHINYAEDTDGLTSSIPEVAHNTKQIIVPGRTLNDILGSLDNVPAVIDLLSLDIEGYEAEALQGLDLSRWNITYMLIENKEGKDMGIGEHYLFIDVLGEHDWLYKRK